MSQVVVLAPLAVQDSEAPALRDLASHLRELIKFRRDDDALLSLLWGAQCWLGPEVLPEKCVIYLVFVGPKSSGKTTATETMTEIVDGKYIAGGTTASIRDILSKRPKALGIDEVDIRMKAVPDLEGILRVGNKWNATYTLRVPKGDREWDTSPQNVGRPKVMNYRNDPEDALSSRAIVIELEPCNDVRLILDVLFGSTKVVAIRDALKDLASEATQKWNATKVREHMQSDDFRKRVQSLKAVTPRGSQNGAILLAIADIMGWDAEEAIRGYLSAERDDAFQVEREFMLEIYDEHSSEARDGILELSNAEVHFQMNNRLRKQGLRPLGRGTWKRIRRELRIKDRRESAGLVLVFDESTREAIGA
jgi:hypothetical protein